MSTVYIYVYVYVCMYVCMCSTKYCMALPAGPSPRLQTQEAAGEGCKSKASFKHLGTGELDGDPSDLWATVISCSPKFTPESPSFSTCLSFWGCFNLQVLIHENEHRELSSKINPTFPTAVFQPRFQNSVPGFDSARETWGNRW